jgi:hypothetical protein
MLSGDNVGEITALVLPLRQENLQEIFLGLRYDLVCLERTRHIYIC